MIPQDLLEDYLIDQDEGLKKLLTWFLNLVTDIPELRLHAIIFSAFDPKQSDHNDHRIIEIRDLSMYSVFA